MAARVFSFHFFTLCTFLTILLVIVFSYHTCETTNDDIQTQWRVRRGTGSIGPDMMTNDMRRRWTIGRDDEWRAVTSATLWAFVLLVYFSIWILCRILNIKTTWIRPLNVVPGHKLEKWSAIIYKLGLSKLIRFSTLVRAPWNIFRNPDCLSLSSLALHGVKMGWQPHLFFCSLTESNWY